MAIQSMNDDLTPRLMKALGIGDLQVSNFDLHVHSEDIISVSVEYYPNKDQLNKAISVLEEYELKLGKEIGKEIKPKENDKINQN